MKTTITILALALVSTLSKGDHLNSSFTVSLYDQSAIAVSIDERGYGAPGTSISIDRLEPGRHFMRVVRIVHAYGWSQAAIDYFAGYVDIPFQSEVVGVVTRNHRLKILDVIAMVPPVYNPVNYYGPQCEQPTLHNYSYLSDREFDEWMNSMRNRSFESTKLEMAKQMISMNKLKTRQVLELMRVMTFESTKLEIAKFAYNRTIDRENYFRVNDAFTFESSISELDHFIQQQG